MKRQQTRALFLGSHNSIKQQQRQRLRKRHLKSEVALLQTLSRLFFLIQFAKSWHFLNFELNAKRLTKVQKEKKEVVSLCSRPPRNVKLGPFTS